MLYSEESVKANIRNREGKRVFFLGEGDCLTPSARDWLQREHIEIRPAAQAAIRSYRTQAGAVLTQKPEHLTHLRGDLLVPKSAPIIAFRGAVDELQAELLLAQRAVDLPTRRALEEILTLARNLLRWEVMQEPAVFSSLCGLTAEQLRAHSHRPQDYYGQPHFMPNSGDGAAILQLNKVRCAARNAELAAARAFDDGGGGCTRSDLLTALNRMSSMLYILMIRLKAHDGGSYGKHRA